MSGMNLPTRAEAAQHADTDAPNAECLICKTPFPITHGGSPLCSEACEDAHCFYCHLPLSERRAAAGIPLYGREYDPKELLYVTREDLERAVSAMQARIREIEKESLPEAHAIRSGGLVAVLNEAVASDKAAVARIWKELWE